MKATNRFAVRSHNGHCARRYIRMEILAIKGHAFTRFVDVCPLHCLDAARSLHVGGWSVTAVYAYYTPFSGGYDYEEATWIHGQEAFGLTNGSVSVQDGCVHG